MQATSNESASCLPAEAFILSPCDVSSRVIVRRFAGGLPGSHLERSPLPAAFWPFGEHDACHPTPVFKKRNLKFRKEYLPKESNLSSLRRMHIELILTKCTWTKPHLSVILQSKRAFSNLQRISPPFVACLRAFPSRDARITGVVDDQRPGYDGPQKLTKGPPRGKERQRPLKRWGGI